MSNEDIRSTNASAAVGAVAVPVLRRAKAHKYIPRKQLGGLAVAIRFRTEDGTWMKVSSTTLLFQAAPFNARFK